MTDEQKKSILIAAAKDPQAIHTGSILFGAQHVIENPFDFNLVSCDAFKKEPVAALLTNALLHCTNEQLIALRNGLNERTGDKLFGREEVGKLLAEQRQNCYQSARAFWYKDGECCEIDEGSILNAKSPIK